MKLSMSIIKEEFGEHVSNAAIEDAVSLELTHVEVFQPEAEKLDAKALYIVATDDVMKFADNGERAHAVIVATNDNDAAVFPIGTSTDKDWIMLGGGVTLDWTVSTASRIFEKYNGWCERVYRSIFEHEPLSNTLDICAEPLVNPFCVVDLFATVIGIGGMPPETPDAIWQQIIEQGTAPFERYPELSPQTSVKSSTPLRVLLPEEGLAGVFCAFHVNGEAVAFAGSSESIGPYTDAQFSVFSIVQKLLEETRAFEKLLSYSQDRMSFPLSQLLRGEKADEGMVELSLRKWGVDRQSVFQVLFLRSDDHGEMPAAQVSSLATRLGNMLGNGIVSPLDEGVVALLRTPLTAADESSIVRMLDRFNLDCALSDAFRDFSYARLAYLQCRSVMSYRAEAHDHDVSRFSDFYEECLISLLGKNENLGMLCDSRILELLRDEQGDELVNNLRAYLVNGCNAAAAAERLFMHRNSLVYRIDKIEQIIGIDIRKLDATQRLRLLLSCIIAPKLPGAPKDTSHVLVRSEETRTMLP